MTQQTDVLVIGGGVVGICTAHFLQEQGREVTVVEKDEVCAGSSYGNAGLIVPSHSVPLAEPGVIAQGLRWMFDPDSPFYIKWRWDRDLVAWLWQFRKASTMRRVRQAMPLLRDMHLESFRLYEALAEELDFAFGHEGRLLLCKTEQGMESVHEEAELMQEIGIEVEMVDAQQAQQCAEVVELDCVGAERFNAQDAHLDPARLVRALAARCVERGVQLNEKTEVLGFGKQGRRIAMVETTRGDFAADEVVLCSGAWSPGVGRGLGLSLPVQPAKGYSVTVHKPDPCPEVPADVGEAASAPPRWGTSCALPVRSNWPVWIRRSIVGGRCDCQCGAALCTGVDVGCVGVNRGVAGSAALYAGWLALFGAAARLR